MKKALFCLALILPALILTQVTEEWVARYDGPLHEWDYATDIVVDDNGNVYVTGFCSENIYGADYTTIKYNSTGNEKWVACYEGPEDGKDEASGLAIDNSGNIYVTGRSEGLETGFDYATVKYNSKGEEQWVARYDGPRSMTDEAVAIAVDSSCNVYVTGSSVGTGNGTGNAAYDYVTVKYDSLGNKLWVARYDGPVNGFDEAYAMALDDQGNVYVTGVSGSPSEDYATVKFDNLGNQLWAARYNGPGNMSDEALAIAVSAQSNVYVAGYSENEVGVRDYVTIKYNPEGEEQWVARYNGIGDHHDKATSIAVDDFENVYVTGHSDGSYNDYATVKYNASGEEQWVVRYEGPYLDGDDKPTAMVLDSSGDVYVTGYSQSSYHLEDYLTVKYSSSGSEVWKIRYNENKSSNNIATAMALDGSGNVYVTGWSTGSNGDYDYATIKYSQGPGIAEASVDAPEYLLEVTQLVPEPVISYTLPVSTHVSLKLFDVTGQLVKTLVSGSQEAGTHTVRWPVTHPKTPSGVYFVRLETSNCSATAKLVVAR